MDLADLADRQIEAQMEAALSRASRLRSGADSENTHCSECASFIPLERRRAIPNVDTCVDCAEALEAADRNMGKNVGAWWW